MSSSNIIGNSEANYIDSQSFQKTDLQQPLGGINRPNSNGNKKQETNHTKPNNNKDKDDIVEENNNKEQGMTINSTEKQESQLLSNIRRNSNSNDSSIKNKSEKYEKLSVISQQKRGVIQEQISELASPTKKQSLTSKEEEDKSIRQKLFSGNEDNKNENIEEKHKQIDIDQTLQQVDDKNFSNISQEIIIQDLSAKKALIGINISPNSKVTINRTLSNSYFGDNDQDDRSIYQDQEKLYSPTLANQVTTKSKNESELDLSSSPKQSKKQSQSDIKNIGEFNVTSPKNVQKQIHGYAEDLNSDIKNQSQSKINKPPSPTTPVKDNTNYFQGRDNTKKLSIKMNQVVLDEDFKKQQEEELKSKQLVKILQPTNLNSELESKNSYSKIESVEVNQKENQQLQNKINQEQEAKQYQKNQEQVEGDNEEDEEEEDEEEEEEVLLDEDEEEEEEEEEEKNNEELISDINQQKQNNINEDQNVKQEGEKDNQNINILQSEQYYEDIYKNEAKKSQELQQYQQQEIRVLQHDKQVYLRVSKIQDGIATLISEDYSTVEMPIMFLPADITCGSIIKLSIDREYDPEEEMRQSVLDIQQSILNDPNYFS